MNEQQQDRTLVSVIIPTYNRRDWIGECLDSVLAQTYPNVEIIVVDDRSTDHTVDWLRGEQKYQDVRLHVQEKNGGASIARNTGIEMANGDLIAFIDSDDTLEPTHIESAVRHFEEYPELGLFCCDSRMIDADGNIILDGKTWHDALAEARGLDIRSGFRSLDDVFTSSNCFPGFTLRRETFRKLGGFDQSIFPADDYDLALRVAGSEYKVFYLHEPLCLRREHDGQLSGIQNSVKTQVQLIRALVRCVEANPGKIPDELVKRRVADLRLELGISKVKEGDRFSGLMTMLRTVASSPEHLRSLARIGQRRLKKLSSVGD